MRYDLYIYVVRRQRVKCNCNISTFHDTRWPDDGHNWFKHVALLIRPININISQVVLTVNKRFSVAKYISTRRSNDHHKYPSPTPSPRNDTQKVSTCSYDWHTLQICHL